MKTKLLNSFLLALIAALLPQLASAYDFKVGRICYNIISDNEVETTYEKALSPSNRRAYNSFFYNLVIPETVMYNNKTYTVSRIGDLSFYNSVIVDSLSFPNTIKYIGLQAFKRCNIKKIVIPCSVISIDDSFGGTDDNGPRLNRLEEIIVDEGNQIYDSRNNCNAIIETESNTLIIGCDKTIIPNSVTTIGRVAFLCCGGFTSVTIPNSVTSIGYVAFWGCSGLTSVTIPNSVTSIGYHAFDECNSLTSLSLIGNGSWNLLDNMPDVNQIDTINIGKGVTSLGNFSFIPDVVNCYAETPPTCSSSTFSNYDGELHVAVTSIADYFIADYWQNFNNMVNDLGKLTLDKASANLVQWETLTLHAAVTYEGDGVIWSTTNPSIATVDENGIVTATGGGECDIYATLASSHGAEYAICHISVSYPKISLSLSEDYLNMHVGDEQMLTVTLTPENTGLTPIWLSSDTNVATVDASGKVTAIGEGECYITVKVLDETATCHITVSYPDITITLSDEWLEMNVGNVITLTAIINPDNTGLTPIWASSDENVALVNNGIVTAIGDGECDITATVLDKTATCHVKVGVNVLISLHENNFIIGASQMLTVYPSCTPDVPVELVVTSSNPSVALARVVNRTNAPAAGLMSFPEKSIAMAYLKDVTNITADSKAPALASEKAIMIVGVQNGTATITVTTADGMAVPAVLELRVVDVDGDKVITSGDITALYNYLLNGDETYLNTSDVNGDDFITSSDITVIYNILLGN